MQLEFIGLDLSRIFLVGNDLANLCFMFFTKVQPHPCLTQDIVPSQLGTFMIFSGYILSLA